MDREGGKGCRNKMRRGKRRSRGSKVVWRDRIGKGWESK